MTKNSGFSSDLDLIKEFEELRLKQKILIESLKRKEGSKDQDLLVELNSKIDFLVKIFKDSTDTDFDEKSYLDEHFKALNDRFERFNQLIENRLSQVEIQIKSLSDRQISYSKTLEDEDKKKSDIRSEKEKDIDSQINKIKDETEESLEVEEKEPDTPKKIEEKQKEVETKSQEKVDLNSSKDGPPIPDFKIDEDKVENLASNTQTTKEKKKGWF